MLVVMAGVGWLNAYPLHAVHHAHHMELDFEAFASFDDQRNPPLGWGLVRLTVFSGGVLWEAELADFGAVHVMVPKR